jgi:hypothetical protein
MLLFKVFKIKIPSDDLEFLTITTFNKIKSKKNAVHLKQVNSIGKTEYKNAEMIIYRFIGNPEFILTTLLNGQLWFSKVGDFNDPFEWTFRYCIDIERDKKNIMDYVNQNTFNLPIEVKREKFNSYINTPFTLETEFNRIFYKFYNQGVCCFTKKENIKSVLMWAYYANSHKGIALGFDDKEIEIRHIDDFKNDEHIIKPLVRRVIYDNHKKCINPFDKQRPDILDTKYMKTKECEHEKEVRFVSPKFGLHSFVKTNLKEIVFGINSSAILKDAVFKILENEIDYKNVKIRYCKPEENELKMKIE